MGKDKRAEHIEKGKERQLTVGPEVTALLRLFSKYGKGSGLIYRWQVIIMAHPGDLSHRVSLYSYDIFVHSYYL
jgi:hypothetical protein